jgi:hypothetical protein
LLGEVLQEKVEKLGLNLFEAEKVAEEMKEEVEVDLKAEKAITRRYPLDHLEVV